MALNSDDCKIEVSADKMEARATLFSGDAAGALTYEALLAVLNEANVRGGIDHAALRLLAEKPIFNSPQLVARGTPAQNGKDEEVIYKFPITSELKPAESESGSVDFRNVENFNNIRAGDVLAEKEPATGGSAGVNVLGVELLARKGKERPLRVGKGAKLSDDGMSAVADINGHACIAADRITVLDTVEVPADVDYSVGNISFIGNVRIRGGVKSDFTVEAKGNIEIFGNVEKAKIDCGGELTIRGIVFGQGNCSIHVGGNAQIGALDQAELVIRGDLNVGNYIRHSSVLVGGSVNVSGKKGTIVGGEVCAYSGITAPFVGNNMATLTKLTVGTNPFASREVKAVQAQHDEMETKVKQINNALRSTGERQKLAGGADPKSQALMGKLTLARDQLEPQLEKLTKELERVKATLSDFKGARIRIAERVHPGVVINFRNRYKLKTNEELQHLSFYEEDAAVRTGSY
ncbi:DUF342 domain-containing protein [bacterium]|nr:DUF342 domain-containing protein [bacterium]